MSMWEDYMENYIFGWLCVHLNKNFTFEKYGLVLKQNTQSWQLLGALLRSPMGIGAYGRLLCVCVCVCVFNNGRSWLLGLSTPTNETFWVEPSKQAGELIVNRGGGGWGGGTPRATG